MTIFKVMGGLGNQLFIAAAASAFAQVNRLGNVFLDLRGTAKSARHGGTHKYASNLLEFSLPPSLKPVPKTLNPFLFSLEGAAALLQKVGLNGQSTRLLSRTLVHTFTQVGFESAIFSERPFYFRGYFQSYKYLEYLVENNVAFDLPLASHSDQFLLSRNKVLEFGKFGVIHFRRGDYKSKLNNFGLLSSRYYEEAIERATFDSGVSNYLAFSDDPIDALSPNLLKFMKRYSVEFVETGNLHPHEVLSIMRLGSTFCIANSSFSWWAASLSRSQHVCYPQTWFKHLESPRYLTSDSWKPIPSYWEE